MLARLCVATLLALSGLPALAGTPPPAAPAPSAPPAPAIPLAPSHAGTSTVSSTHAQEASARAQQPHSRQKRLLWVTNDGRLALPPGTALVITPSLSLPFVRYPPDGFLSNMPISLPFTIDFDKLGLTDNENPYGVLPPLLARSMGRMSGALLADYVERVLERRRLRRDAPPPQPPPHANFHGGERGRYNRIRRSEMRITAAYTIRSRWTAYAKSKHRSVLVFMRYFAEFIVANFTRM